MTRTEIRPNTRQFSDQTVLRSVWVLTLWVAFSLISAIVLTGCGSEPQPLALPKETLHPTTGKVVNADNTPLTEGIVTFVPKKANAREALGKIQSDGSFVVKTGDLGDGLAEGVYGVKIESNLTAPGPKAGTTKPLVPVEYLDEASSNLTANIKSGSNDLPPFKLVPVPKKANKGASRGAGVRADD